MLPPINGPPARAAVPNLQHSVQSRLHSDGFDDLRRQIHSLHSELRRLQDVSIELGPIDTLNYQQLVELRNRKQEQLIFALKRQLSQQLAAPSSSSKPAEIAAGSFEALKRDNDVLELRSRTAVDTVASLVPVFASTAPQEIFDAFLRDLSDDQRALVASTLRQRTQPRGPTPSMQILLVHWADCLDRMVAWCLRSEHHESRRGNLGALLSVSVSMLELTQNQMMTLHSLIELSLQKLSASHGMIPPIGAIDAVQSWLCDVLLSIVEILASSPNERPTPRARLLTCQQLLYHLSIAAHELGAYGQRPSLCLFSPSPPSSASAPSSALPEPLLRQHRNVLLALFISHAHFDGSQLFVLRHDLITTLSQQRFPHSALLSELCTQLDTMTLNWPQFCETCIDLSNLVRLDRSPLFTPSVTVPRALHHLEAFLSALAARPVLASMETTARSIDELLRTPRIDMQSSTQHELAELYSDDMQLLFQWIASAGFITFVFFLYLSLCPSLLQLLPHASFFLRPLCFLPDSFHCSIICARFACCPRLSQWKSPWRPSSPVALSWICSHSSARLRLILF